jgi:hypothetical protein
MESKNVPEDIRRIVRITDSAIRIPGTSFRIGLDGLIGLIPGIGDAAGVLISFFIIWRGAASGASSLVLARMIANVALDSIVGAVPVLGDFFDFAFRSNEKNLRLLERHFSSAGEPELPAARRLGIALVIIFSLALCAIVGAIAGVISLLKAIF